MKSIYNIAIKTYNESTKQVKIFERAVLSQADIDMFKQRSMSYDTHDDPELEVDIDDPEKTQEEIEDAHLHSVNSSVNRTKVKVYDYARSNKWEWFVTFTFNPGKVDRTDYDAVSKKLKNTIDRWRKFYAPDIRYVIVPEYHKDGKSFHFHAVMSSMGDLDIVPSINPKTGRQRSAKGRPVYNLRQYTLGYCTLTQVTDSKKVANYIAKYITKELCTVTQNKRRYWASKNLLLPEVQKMMMQTDDVNMFRATIHPFKQFKKVIECKDAVHGYEQRIEVIELDYSDNVELSNE